MPCTSPASASRWSTWASTFVTTTGGVISMLATYGEVKRVDDIAQAS